MEAIFQTKDEFAQIGQGVQGIKINVTTPEGNVFNIIGLVRRIMKQLGASPELVKQFTNEVTSAKSYCEALEIVQEWVNIEFENSDC